MPQLTDNTIRAAIRANKAASLSDDTGTKGTGRLVLRIRPRPGAQPAATWLAQRYDNGRRVMQTLGQYPALSLAAARRAQRDANPKARTKGAATLGELMAAYLGTLEGRRSYALSKDITARLFAVVNPGKPAAAVTADDLRPWLADIHKTAPGMAARSRAVVHAAYNWAIKSESSYTATHENRFNLTENPASRIAADPKAKRAGQRCLNAAELAAVFAWAAKDNNPASRALLIQIFTGCRVEEALSLTREHIDRGRELITWQTTKTGKPHRLPILPGLGALLDSLQTNRHGLYFPNPAQPAKPLLISSLVKIAMRCSRDLQIPHWTPRDLRRSWATLAADYAGIGFEARERVQAHALPGIGEIHYSHSAQHEQIKREALKAWESFLLSLIGEGEAK